MPNRVIKETIQTSKSVNSLSDFHFRVWLYLITYVDDYGRGSADPEILKGRVFTRRKGLTESQIASALTDLANAGMIVLYEVGGEPYLRFPNWSDHQRIQNKKSKFPEPPAESTGSQALTVSHGDSPWIPVSHGNPPPESNPNPNPNPNTNPEPEPAHARTAARPDFDTLEVYASGNLANLSPRNMDELISFRDVMTDDLIRYAIDEACAQGVRTWAYTRSILNRYLKDGYKTPGDVQAHDAHKKQQKPAAQNPALNYEQRSSSETKYASLFIDLDHYFDNPEETP